MRKVFVDNIVGSDESSSIAVAGAVTVYTKAFKIDYAEYFSLDYKALSASGAPDLKIEIEQSIGDNLPATEGSSDTNYVEAENMADIETSLTTETWHKKTINPAVSKYARLKITGAAGNNADTIFTAKLNRTEEL